VRWGFLLEGPGLKLAALSALFPEHVGADANTAEGHEEGPSYVKVEGVAVFGLNDFAIYKVTRGQERLKRVLETGRERDDIGIPFGRLVFPWPVTFVPLAPESPDDRVYVMAVREPVTVKIYRRGPALPQNGGFPHYSYVGWLRLEPGTYIVLDKDRNL